MGDYIKREDAIQALNECIDIKGYAYRAMHDAIMSIPAAEESEKNNDNGLLESNSN